MVLQSPVGICVVDAPTLISEIVNDSFIKVAGKPRDAIIGKMYWDTFAEVRQYEAALSEVITSGVPYQAQEVELMLIRHGREEIVHVTFVYAPMKDSEGTVKKVAIWVLDNTPQVLARKAIEESNREFQVVTDFMPQMIWLTRPDGYHYYYNKQWYDYTGLTYGQTEGEGWNNVFHPGDQLRALKVWRHSLATGEPYQIEYRCRRYDGEYRWFLGRALPLRDESGVILKWFGTCTDIDDQKRAEEVLEQNEAKARLAVESAQLATYEVDLVSQTMAYSSRLAQIYALDSTRQWPYKTFTDAVHPDDVGVRLKALEESKQTGDLFYEVRILRPDASIRWIRLNGKMKFQDGVPVILVGTVMDITEEKRAAEVLEQKIEERTRELEAQQSLLNNIMINSSNGISVTEMIRDERGNIIDARTILANDAAVKFTGLPKDVYLSVTATELDPNIFSSSYGLTCMKTLQTGEPSLSQYYLDSAQKWLELTISKMDDEHLIHIFTDVTPIKVAQLQLERTVEELRRSNVNLEEFAYSASHDLKEPVRKVHFFSEKIRSTLQDRMTEQEKQSFDRMELAAKRMNSLIDDLLSYSQISIRPRTIETVNMNQLIDLVLQDLDLEIEDKKATITVDNLFTIQGHHRQLQQAFQNLIGNALKYRKPGVAPQVKVSCSKVKGYETGLRVSAEDGQKTFYCITVQDNGIGFEQQDAERIFNVFTRLHGNTEYKGTGIGLSIVRKVVENHQGYIWAEGKPGEGASFKVILPAE
jgi:PAS domain S-box-containing protein